MKGKVTIYLRDKNGKTLKKLTDHNLVTTGLQDFYDLAQTSGDYYYYTESSSKKTYYYYCYTAKTYLETLLYPLATEALGGILLFDDTLEASTSNTKLTTSSPHIVGYADEITDLSELSFTPPTMGVFSEDESGETSDGYRLVWLWEGEQLVGASVKSLALVNNVAGGPGYGPFCARRTRKWLSSAVWTRTISDVSWHAWSAYDAEEDTQGAFYIDDDGTYVYCALFDLDASTMSITKRLMNGDGTTTLSETVSTTTCEYIDSYINTYATSAIMHLGYDGYAYLVGDATGDEYPHHTVPTSR